MRCKVAPTTVMRGHASMRIAAFDAGRQRKLGARTRNRHSVGVAWSAARTRRCLTARSRTPTRACVGVSQRGKRAWRRTSASGNQRSCACRIRTHAPATRSARSSRTGRVEVRASVRFARRAEGPSARVPARVGAAVDHGGPPIMRTRLRDRGKVRVTAGSDPGGSAEVQGPVGHDRVERHIPGLHVDAVDPL